MAKLSDNVSLWHQIMDTAMEGLIAVDAKGYIRHINAAAARSLGFPPAAAIGKHFSSVLCPSLPKNQCWVSLALRRGESVRNHHFVMETADGGTRRLVANLTIFSDRDNKLGALVALQPDDELHDLQAEREKEQAILGSLSEGLYTVDNEWRITSLNRAGERMTGWQEQEVLGKYCKHVFGSAACTENCPLAETLRRGKPVLDFEAKYVDKSGKDLPVFVNTAILYNSGDEAIGGVISFRDCSARNMASESKSHTGFHGIIGKNKRMREVYQLIEDVADSNATVLILGESGTGKELVANAIQKLSPRRVAPFVRVNCAAIPDTLLESELFGHVRGAFTDAHADRIGRFAMADGGTIFLDEVGDLTPPAQLRLLRVLEDGEFQRLGSSDTVKVDVRVIAATNRNLWQLVQGGTFRDDLYFRLNVILIALPTLAERRDDLPFLIEHFMAKYRCMTGRQITDMSDKAHDLLMAYDYPGNVRELENIIEHAFARTRGQIITDNKLPVYLRQADPRPAALSVAGNGTQNDEAARIVRVLQRNHWNREKAADDLGMSRTTLWRRMRELDLV